MHVATLSITDRYSGPLLLKEGFRPFFLAASAWACMAMLGWIGILSGVISPPKVFAPVDWHQHEMLFGYTSAVIGGFLLTVAANWTGRPPISGKRLLVLLALWVAGRVVLYESWGLNAFVVAGVDLAFPIVLSLLVGRELIVGHNRKNLVVVGVFGLITLANALFHYEVWNNGAAMLSTRLGLSAILILIMLIGGRIIPAFTRNWLMRRNATRLPTTFNSFDAATLMMSAVTLIVWAVVDQSNLIVLMLLISALLNALRLVRWAGYQTVKEPLLCVLHVAFAFIPLGFLAMALAIYAPHILSVSTAMHSWTTGAIGMICMAVMTRASLGHTGQELRAGRFITLIYVLLMTSIVVRFVTMWSSQYLELLQVSAVCWCLAHAGFVLRYGRLFCTAR